MIISVFEPSIEEGIRFNCKSMKNQIVSCRLVGVLQYLHYILSNFTDCSWSARIASLISWCWQ